MDHGRLRFIHCRNAPAVGNWECECLGVPQPTRRLVSDGMLATFVRTALALLTRYCNSLQQKQHNKLLCDECWLRFPWTNNPRGVRGYLLFIIVALLLCCCVRCTSSCACAPSVRAVDTTDRSRRVCMRWSLVCRSCLLLPLPSVCCCCGRAVCVPAAVDWSVCRAWCAAYGACVAAALSSCGVPSLCVCRTSRLPCCSPCTSLCRSAPHH
ncbi:mucin TcMUC [Trypanosoma cruzi Dm28c]|uniref:Mucin TcMUC n=1 Tax=Trypanosoma cruzi Dm28c TaxID=1416333 RepID=V5BA43_TRYCR|nr:mucin TcMUC [Trypanosoma cruzi Dm28c]